MSILDQVPSEAKCRAMVRRAAFGRSPYCPHCQYTKVRPSGPRFFCPRCRRKFSLTSCTWMRRCRLPYRKVLALLLCWQRAVPFGLACSLAGVSAPTGRRWYRLFRSNFPPNEAEFSGTVEVDEAFFGRRRHGRQRIVLGMIERRTGRIALRRVPRRDDEQTDGFILDHAVGGTTVCTDGARCYEGIDAFWGYRHVVCNHSRFVFGPTNRIESTWSRLKRFLRRTVGRPTCTDFDETLREFEWRVNSPEIFDSPLKFLQMFLNPVPLACS
jgi:transposase-like protein